MRNYKISKFVTKRLEESDYRYGDMIVSKMINGVMQDGKKTIALKIVYSAIDQLNKSKAVKIEGDTSNPLDRFKTAVENASPYVEVKSRRVGGATYKVPLEVKESRRINLSLRWLREAAEEKKGLDFDKALAQALIDSCNLIGSAVQKKNNNIAMAKENQAFAHYRW